MKNSDTSIIEDLTNLIDKIENEVGDIEGLEVRCRHCIDNGERQTYATIEEVVVIRLTRVQLDTKDFK